MPKGKRHTPEQIVRLLQKADEYEVQGLSKGQIADKLGITAQTLLIWRKQYRGITVETARELKQLRDENAKLKRLLADQVLESDMLRELAKGKF